MNNNNKGDERNLTDQAFEKLVAQKLVDYQPPEDLERDWDRIERDLRSIKRRKAVRRWLAYSAVAAMLLIAVLLGVDMKHPAVGPASISEQHLSASEEPRVATVSAKESTQQDNSTPVSKRPSGVSGQLDRHAAISAGFDSPENPDDKREEASGESAGSLPEVHQNILTDKGAAAPSLAGLTQGKADSLIEAIDFEAQEKMWKEVSSPVQQASTREWMASAGFGGALSGGLNPSSDQMSDFPQADIGPFSSPSFSNLSPSLQGMSKNLWADFDDVDHSVPLSFGVSLRKNMGERWAVESGVVYTYLSSKFLWDKPWSKYSVTQQLHYVGVPIGIVWYAVNKPSWNIYLLGGGMLEKGIQASYRKEEYFGSASRSSMEMDNIDGLQLSIYGSAGVTYRLYKGVGMYLEPRVSYYFKNSQPLSIRTDWPITVGAVVGFRFEF